jgi:hypothetical protein
VLHEHFDSFANELSELEVLSPPAMLFALVIFLAELLDSFVVLFRESN